MLQRLVLKSTLDGSDKRLCKDCKFALDERLVSRMPSESWLCTRFVHHEVGRYGACELARSLFGGCGPEALGFEAGIPKLSG
jgi:hypothetical protein